MLAIINFVGGGVFLLIGLYLLYAKDAGWMIAGYNDLSEAERATWNEMAMRRFIAAVLIVSAIVFVVAGALVLLDFYPMPVIIASWCIFGAAIIICLIYLNKNPKFRV